MNQVTKKDRKRTGYSVQPILCVNACKSETDGPQGGEQEPDSFIPIKDSPNSNHKYALEVTGKLNGQVIRDDI